MEDFNLPCQTQETTGVAQHPAALTSWSKQQGKHPRPIRWLSQTIISRPNTKQPRRLLELPQEIVFIIIEFLDFADTFFLSKTCVALRSFIQRDWPGDFAMLAPREQKRTMMKLTEGLLDVWFCPSCNRPHRVELEDYPGNAERLSPKPDNCLCIGPRHRHVQPYPRASINHGFLEHHVQLARKYSRYQRNCGSNPYEAYLAKLLQPWSQEARLLPRESISFHLEILKGYYIIKKAFTLAIQHLSGLLRLEVFT